MTLPAIQPCSLFGVLQLYGLLRTGISCGGSGGSSGGGDHHPSSPSAEATKLHQTMVDEVDKMPDTERRDELRGQSCVGVVWCGVE